MKELSTVERELSIVIPGAVVAKELDRAYRSLSGRVRMKGFRKGKIPRYVLEQYYKDDTEQQVLEKIIGDGYRDAIKEHSLQPVSSPNIEPKAELLPGMDFAFMAKVEIKPEIDLGDYKGLELEKVDYVVDDSTVDERIEQLRKRFVEVKPVEDRESIQQGDLVECNYSGTLDDEPVKGLSGVNFVIEVGAGRFYSEAEQALVGKKLGESFDVDVKLPEDFQTASAADKTVTLKIKPAFIKVQVFPELNDELAQDIDEDVETMDALKTKLHEQLSAQAEDRSSGELRNAALDALIERVEFELPMSLVESQGERLAQEQLINLVGQEQAQMIWAQERTNLLEQARPVATKQVRGGLLLEKLVEEEKIEPTEADLDAHLEKMSKTMGQSKKKLKVFYKKSDRWDDLRHQVSTQRALDLLIDAATVKTSSKPLFEAEKSE